MGEQRLDKQGGGGARVGEAKVSGSVFKAAAVGAAGYPVLESLGITYRWQVNGREHLDRLDAANRHFILALWQGRILPATLFFRGRGGVVLASENFDGECITRLLARFGYHKGPVIVDPLTTTQFRATHWFFQNQKRLAAIGFIAQGNDPAALQALVTKELAFWAPIFQASGFKP